MFCLLQARPRPLARPWASAQRLLTKKPSSPIFSSAALPSVMVRMRRRRTGVGDQFKFGVLGAHGPIQNGTMVRPAHATPYRSFMMDRISPGSIQLLGRRRSLSPSRCTSATPPARHRTIRQCQVGSSLLGVELTNVAGPRLAIAEPLEPSSEPSAKTTLVRLGELYDLLRPRATLVIRRRGVQTGDIVEVIEFSCVVIGCSLRMG